MAHNDEDDIGAQVSSRLDELFGEEDEEDGGEPSGQAPDAAPEDQQDPEPAELVHDEAMDGADDESPHEQDSPLKKLKALVFGIDWEITDDGMKAFLREIRDLQAQYQHDKVLSTFLKLHETVGKYIKAKKGRAHPEAFNFVASVFQSFEEVLTNPGMQESRKKKLLSREIRNFKNFKEKLAAPGKTGQGGPAELKGDGAAELRAETPETVVEPRQPEEVPAERAEADEKPAAAAYGRTDAVLENQEALDYIVAELKKTIKAEFNTIRQILKNLGA
ncbi:MAG: hypothetical protein ACLFQ9_00815 [Desulfobacterales bacterium]